MSRERRNRADPPVERFAARREEAAEQFSISPSYCPPRGRNRAQAASYVGVGVSTFDKMVLDGRMPKPLLFRERIMRWDRLQLDEALDALRDDGQEHDGLPEPQV
jgi:predicted DNA-binding transcriptional regulator AlpA